MDPATKRALTPTEDQEAFWLASWLTLNRVFFIHIPNEGKRSRFAGYKLKRMGLMPGASDFLIFDSPPNFLESKGVAIELKRKGEKPTDAQAKFLIEMRSRGWEAFWIETGEAAAAELEKTYGYRRR